MDLKKNNPTQTTEQDELMGLVLKGQIFHCGELTALL